MLRTLVIISLAAAAASGSALANEPYSPVQRASVTVSLVGKDDRTIRADIRKAATAACLEDLRASVMSFEVLQICTDASVDRAMADLARIRSARGFAQARGEATAQAPARP